MNRSMQGIGAGTAMLAAVGIAVLALNSDGIAQEPPRDMAPRAEGVRMQEPGMAPMPRGQRPMQEPGMSGHMERPMGMMMGPGPSTMIDDDDNLYIMRGSQLFKVSKRTMQVTGEGHLPEPKHRMEPGRPEAGSMPPDRLPPTRGDGRP